MSRSQINLQDAFLNHVRKEHIPVVINMSGGGKIEGLVKGFDNFVILLKHDGQHLIYKHAINTIVPERPVDLAGHARAQEGAETVEAAQSASEPAQPAPPPQVQDEPWVDG